MPVASSVRLGRDVVIPHRDLVNLYGCEVGDETKIGAFVEIQKNAAIGARCKISSHTFICEGVAIEDEVFVGHGVMFINDRYPRATAGGGLQTEADWNVIPTRVRKGASIGSGAVIMCGVTIGERALIDEAEKRGLVLMVDHTFVYTTAVARMRELTQSGDLGEIYYYDSVRINLGLFQHDVNVLWDLAVHDLSIMDYVLAQTPVAVSA